MLYLQGKYFDDPKRLLRNVKEIGHQGTGGFEFSLIIERVQVAQGPMEQIEGFKFQVLSLGFLTRNFELAT